jgi:pimeloyl-ACP methyl ester carboxylesterase
MPYATSPDGTRVYYEVEGDGFPIVLHTGAGGDLLMWRAAGYTAGLGSHRLILMDHRGHGRSDRPRDVEAHRMERYVADVNAVLDAAGVVRAAFWGYSDGARVGYALAAARPDRVAALIAQGGMDAADAKQQRKEAGQRQALARRVRKLGMPRLNDEIEDAEHIKLPDWLRQNFLDTDPEMFALELEGWLPWDTPWPLLPTITAPTLLVAGKGEEDGNVARAAGILPDARYAIIPGLGHVGAFLRCDLVLPHARAFLSALRP